MTVLQLGEYKGWFISKIGDDKKFWEGMKRLD